MPEKWDRFNDDSRSDFKRDSRTPASWNKIYPEVKRNNDSAKDRDRSPDRERKRDRSPDRERKRDRSRSREQERDKDRDRSYDRDKESRNREREKDRDGDSKSESFEKPKRKPRVFDQNDQVIVVKKLNDLGDKPVAMICPYCEEKVLTDVEYKVGGGTWAYCGGITAAGLCNPLVWVFCLCWIPFCIPKFKNTKHYCHNCNKYLGINKVI